MEQLNAEYGQFTGGDEVYGSHKGYSYTEGVRQVAQDKEAYWLIDLIVSHQHKERVRRERFQIWTLTVKAARADGESSEAVAEMRTDTHAPVLSRQDIPFTDFPRGQMKFYLIDGVLLLPSEY
jgi:hypothetical protein